MNTTTNQCQDINECQLGVDDCNELRCDNTVGSYHCVRVMDCGTGYTVQGKTCVDIDECALGKHNCEKNYRCRNTEGSFKCDLVNCPPGMRLASDGICHRTICPPGYEFNHTVHMCVPEDLCASNPCQFNERCVTYVNVHREVSYTCFKFCMQGFRLVKACK